MKKVLIILIALLLVACEPTAPLAESDSNQHYGTGSEVPVDTNVYNLEAEVSGDVESVTGLRAEGSALTISGTGGANFSMWEEGKGLLRVMIISITPALDNVYAGKVVILKTTDKKVMALLPGDQVSLKCRNQYEAVAAVLNYEDFDPEEMGTWELDYCRMTDPGVD